VHFTAASSVCVHFLLIQYSVPLSVVRYLKSERW